MATPIVSSLRQMIRTLSDGDEVPPPVPAMCTFGDFTKDTPVDTKGAPSGMGYGARESLISLGAAGIGAAIGAAIPSEHRGRNALIGGAIGAVGAVANLVREFSAWKAAGGSRHIAGACVAPQDGAADEPSAGGAGAPGGSTKEAPRDLGPVQGKP